MHITTNEVNEFDRLRQDIAVELGINVITGQQYALAAYPKEKQLDLERAMQLIDR